MPKGEERELPEAKNHSRKCQTVGQGGPAKSWKLWSEAQFPPTHTPVMLKASST